MWVSAFDILPAMSRRPAPWIGQVSPDICQYLARNIDGEGFLCISLMPEEDEERWGGLSQAARGGV